MGGAPVVTETVMDGASSVAEAVMGKGNREPYGFRAEIMQFSYWSHIDFKHRLLWFSCRKLPSVTNGCCGVSCSASGRFLLCRKAMVVKCGASVEGVVRV